MKKIIAILLAVLIFLLILTVIISNLLNQSTKTTKKDEAITSVPYNYSNNNTNKQTTSDNRQLTTDNSPADSAGKQLTTDNNQTSSSDKNSTTLNDLSNNQQASISSNSNQQQKISSTSTNKIDTSSIKGGDSPLPSEEELLKNSNNTNTSSSKDKEAAEYLAKFLNAILPTSTPSKETTSTTSVSSASTYNNLVYYPQCGGPYDDYSLPGGGTICSSGCGPTSVAMLLSSFIDTKYTPPFVVDLYKENGQPITNLSSAYFILTKYGLTTTDLISLYDRGANEIASDFKKYLDEGWILFVLAHYGQLENGNYNRGHYFIATGIENGQIMALDPYYGSGKPLPLNENLYDPFPKYYYAYGVKK